MKKQQLLEGVSRYVARHPEEVLRLVKNAAFLRLGVPLAALRWLLTQIPGKRAPRDVQIEAVPPGIRMGATLDLMGTEVRASALCYFDSVKLSAEELRFELRLADVSLKLAGDSDSAVATLLKSGALDLTKPGNLAAYMPKRPAFLVEAEGDRIVVDLMKHSTIGKNVMIQRVLGVVTPLITVSDIKTDWEHVDVVFTAFQRGVVDGVTAAVRQALN